MSNLELYRKVCSLKNYLELHDLDSVSQSKLTQSIEYLNMIFEKLERRKK